VIRVAIFGGSFNPPCKHHLTIANELTKFFDKVLVIPCGARPAKDKQSVNMTAAIHRGNMTQLVFKKIPKVEVALFDLLLPEFTPAYLLQERYKYFGEIWHVVGADLIQDGKEGQSKIHSWKRGQEIWASLNFAVVKRDGYQISEDDLPPQSKVFEIADGENYSSSYVRGLVEAGKPFDEFVAPEIAEYIKSHNLYQK